MAGKKWHAQVPDLSGAAKYVVIVRGPNDPERKRKRDPKTSTAWKQLVKGGHVGVWTKRIVELMQDGKPRTFNHMMVELADVTADIAMGNPPEKGLWDAVRQGHLVMTYESPILFKKASRRQRLERMGTVYSSRKAIAQKLEEFYELEFWNSYRVHTGKPVGKEEWTRLDRLFDLKEELNTFPFSPTAAVTVLDEVAGQTAFDIVEEARKRGVKPPPYKPVRLPVKVVVGRSGPIKVVFPKRKATKDLTATGWSHRAMIDPVVRQYFPKGPLVGPSRKLESPSTRAQSMKLMGGIDYDLAMASEVARVQAAFPELTPRQLKKLWNKTRTAALPAERERLAIVPSEVSQPKKPKPKPRPRPKPKPAPKPKPTSPGKAIKELEEIKKPKRRRRRRKPGEIITADELLARALENLK